MWTGPAERRRRATLRSGPATELVPIVLAAPVDWYLATWWTFGPDPGVGADPVEGAAREASRFERPIRSTANRGDDL